MRHQSLVKDSLQMSVELLDVVLLVEDGGHAGRQALSLSLSFAAFHTADNEDEDDSSGDDDDYGGDDERIENNNSCLKVDLVHFKLTFLIKII